MLPCDRDFGNIEKHVRKHIQVVYNPEQWVEVIQKSRKNKPFRVTRVKREMFVSLQQMRGQTNIHQSESGKPFRFKEVRIFHFHEEWPDKMKVKYTFDEEEEEQTIDLNPRTRKKTEC